MFSTNFSGWWVGFGCGWAKLNVVFLGRQVLWQNTSFNFVKRWLFCLFCRSVNVSRLSRGIGHNLFILAIEWLQFTNILDAWCHKVNAYLLMFLKFLQLNKFIFFDRP